MNASRTATLRIWCVHPSNESGPVEPPREAAPGPSWRSLQQRASQPAPVSRRLGRRCRASRHYVTGGLRRCHMEGSPPRPKLHGERMDPTLRREIEQLHERSFAWALACCGWRREEASDVLQTAYLKVFDGRARFDG